mgnify:CR=1 FL=1
MNIPIVQGLLRVSEGKVNFADGKITTESDVSQQKAKLPEAQEEKILPDNPSSSKEQCDALEIFYPPFFPLGNTQGIYSVLNQAKNDVKSADSMGNQKADSSINTEATQQEQLASDRDEMIKNETPESKRMVNLGSVLDLKV